MKVRNIITALLGALLVAGCGVSAPVTTTTSQASQPQRKPSAPLLNLELAFVQPEVDASKYGSAEVLLQRLSQNPSGMGKNEFYAASMGSEPGSATFNKVYETAVKYYPADELVNLNRASARMQQGDYSGAKTYLDKAGNSAAAVYSRGVWYARQGNIQQAVTYFRKAGDMGYPKAETAIQAIASAR